MAGIDPISTAWYEKRPLYEQFANALHDVLDREQRFPREAVYTVKHRLKSNERLLEKCSANAAVSAGNFAEHIADLVGVRIVCLRPSDIDVVKAYLGQLRDDQELSIFDGPSEKKSFVLNPTIELSDSGTDFQYSGYSSIHYVVGLGPKRPVQNPALRGLKAELQVRNIFEEAWGEIDHKYRYRSTRVGVSIPAAVDSGFRALAMYLAAASCHAEYLCRSAEAPSIPLEKTPPEALPGQNGVSSESSSELSPEFVRTIMLEQFGVRPSLRTIGYCLTRVNAHAVRNQFEPTRTWLKRVLEDDATQEDFDNAYKAALSATPFTGSGTDRDVVDFVNFALFRSVFPIESVKNRLKALLEERASGR